MKKPLTADTITDEQIQAAYHKGLLSYDLLEFATFTAWAATNQYYRGRCAAILNTYAKNEMCPRSSIGGHACTNYQPENRCADCPVKELLP
jgi:hypothetical protein